MWSTTIKKACSKQIQHAWVDEKQNRRSGWNSVARKIWLTRIDYVAEKFGILSHMIRGPWLRLLPRCPHLGSVASISFPHILLPHVSAIAVFNTHLLLLLIPSPDSSQFLLFHSQTFKVKQTSILFKKNNMLNYNNFVVSALWFFFLCKMIGAHVDMARHAYAAPLPHVPMTQDGEFVTV